MSDTPKVVSQAWLLNEVARVVAGEVPQEVLKAHVEETLGRKFSGSEELWIDPARVLDGRGYYVPETANFLLATLRLVLTGISYEAIEAFVMQPYAVTGMLMEVAQAVEFMQLAVVEGEDGAEVFEAATGGDPLKEGSESDHSSEGALG